jgi:hypothetical protein
MDDQNRKLVGLILNCKPEDLKGISLRMDGSLAVVAPNGMKFIFSPVELDNARDSFGLKTAAASTPAQQKTLHGANASSVTEAPLAEPVEATLDKSGQRMIGQRMTSNHAGTQVPVKHRRAESRL